MLNAKTYFLLLPAIFIGSFFYIPTIYNYIIAKDGEYSEWSDWSRCMKYCGPSWQGRFRNCTRKSIGYGRTCDSLGPHIETKKCFIRECPIDGKPGPWGNWDKYDKECKGGIRKRYRQCDNPKPEHYGLPCQSALYERQTGPFNNQCPIDGEYQDWSKWSECSVTCGKGRITSTRTCKPPKFGGKPCPKGDKETATIDCKKGECKVEPPKVEPPKVNKTEPAKVEVKKP